MLKLRGMNKRKWLLVFCAVQLLGWILGNLRGLLGAEEDIIFVFPWAAGMLLLSPGLPVSFYIHSDSSLFFRVWFTTACNGVVWAMCFAAFALVGKLIDLLAAWVRGAGHR